MTNCRLLYIPPFCQKHLIIPLKSFLSDGCVFPQLAQGTLVPYHPFKTIIQHLLILHYAVRFLYRNNSVANATKIKKRNPDGHRDYASSLRLFIVLVIQTS